jgi:hypothetical protein
MLQEWRASLFNAITTGGFDIYARIAYEYFKLPVTINDAEYFNLAFYPHEHLEIKDAIWTSLTTIREIPFCMVQDASDNGTIQSFAGKREPYVLPGDAYQNHLHMIGNVFLGDDIVGYVDLTCFGDNDVNEERLQALGILCRAVAIEFERKQYYPKKIKNSFEMFFSRLMERKKIDEKEYRQFFTSHREKLGSLYSIMTIKPEDPGVAGGKDLIVPFLHRSLGQYIPDHVSAIYRDCIYILLSNIANLTHLLDNVERITNTLRSMRLTFGISNPFSNILDMYFFADQADYALKMCRKKKVSQMYYFKCVSPRIVEIVSEHLTAENYIHPGLQMLQEYDSIKGTEYVKTLSSYIISMCSGTDTIQDLNLHRNTLKYRLSAIKKITGLDLNDKETISHLWGNFIFLMHLGNDQSNENQQKDQSVSCDVINNV